jgi:hypothetical protein
MSVSFRAGRDDMKSRDDFSTPFLEVSNENAHAILEALGIAPESEEGTVGEVEIEALMHLCNNWIITHNRPETIQVKFLKGYIIKLRVETEHFIHFQKSFTHICWS